MLTYKLVIFDFDGTLVDSRRAIVAAMQRTFEYFGGSPPSDEAVAATIGMRLEEAVASLTPGLGEDEAAGRAAHYRQIFLNETLDMVETFPGVPGMLDALEDMGVSMAVLSNRLDEALQKVLDRLDLGGRFRLAAGALPGGRAKPDPAFRREDLLGTFAGLDAQEVLVVGDGIEDIHYARNMGLDCCWAAYGYGAPGGCRILEPEYTIERPGELPAIVG